MDDTKKDALQEWLDDMGYSLEDVKVDSNGDKYVTIYEEETLTPTKCYVPSYLI